MVPSLTENYVFAGLCVPLGVFYLIMALMNLLGERLGSPGRRFIFEMDEVMGGLLGIPHYSKLEFVLLMFTSLGFWLTWVLQPEAVLVSVLGILTGTVYMLVCVFYAVYARQNKVAFLIPFLVNLALLIWRSVRYDKLAGQFITPLSSTLPSRLKVSGPRVSCRCWSLRSRWGCSRPHLTTGDAIESQNV